MMERKVAAPFQDFTLRPKMSRMRGIFVYLLYREDEVVYVGFTRALVRRIRDHWIKAGRVLDFAFDSVVVKRMGSEKAAKKEEARLIGLLNPEYNTVGTTYTPKVMEALRLDFVRRV